MCISAFVSNIVLSLIKEPPKMKNHLCRGGYQPPAMFLVLGGWLNGKMLVICTNSPKPMPFCAGRTAREAGSLPYRGRVVVLQFILYLNQINAP